MQYEYKYRRYLPAPSEGRWASVEEIRQNSTGIDLRKKTCAACGIPLDRNGSKVYVNNGDDHALLFGSTGSKKTRTCVFPFIHLALRAGESVVCTDPKGELYARTAETAKQLGYQVLVLNFRDFSNGEGYNPLSAIWDAYHGGRKNEAMEMMNDFIESISSTQKSAKNVDPFWYQTASTFAMSNLLLLMKLANRQEANISSFINLCFEENYEALKKLSEQMDPSTIAGMGYRCIFGESERTRMSTQASLTAMVQQFVCNKRLQNMMSETTFDMSSVARQKTIIYLIMADEKTTYYFLATTFLKQLYEALIHEAQQEKDLRLPIRVNYMLDEFGNIPAIPGFCSAISAARSRNIRYFLVTQSALQLENQYGATGAAIIKSNCNDWFFLNSKELPLLTELSQMCGCKNTRGGNVPLISVPELQHLTKEQDYAEALVLSGRNYPFLAKLPDIDSYPQFRTSGMASLPERRFSRFKLLDFYSIYREIRLGERICPFHFASEDEEDDESLVMLLNRIRSFTGRLTRPGCDSNLIKKAIELDQELDNEAIHAAICELPGGKVAITQFREAIANNPDSLAQLQKELEDKFDALFDSIDEADDDDDD